MSFTPQLLAVTRAGVPLTGSPFLGRVYFVTRTPSQQNVPKIAQTQRSEVCSFNTLSVPVASGDLMTLSDGSLRKILDVRPYSHSLQCDLQRVPFTPLTLWLPKTQPQRVQSQTLKVNDLSFTAALAPILGYLEPAPDEAKFAGFGQMDLRGCFLFSLEKVTLGSVVKDTLGDYWVAEVPSDVWPLPGDYKTLMRHISKPPAGVN